MQIMILILEEFWFRRWEVVEIDGINYSKKKTNILDFVIEFGLYPKEEREGGEGNRGNFQIRTNRNKNSNSNQRGRYVL